MRMFLVGMCDIFLILYLTTLSQVNPFHNSFLTVDDYNKLKEAKVQAEQDSEKSHAQIMELKNEVTVLDKQKEEALQSTLSAKAETEKAMQLVKTEKEKVAQSEIKLSKTISEKEEFNELLQKSHKSEQEALKIVKESKVEAEKAKKRELDALKAIEEKRIEVEKAREKELHALQIVKESQAESEKAKERELSALKAIEEKQKDLEKARKKELQALQIVKAVKIDAEKAREEEQKALELAEKLRLQAEEARKKEEQALKLAEEARLKEEEARKSEEIARKIAEEERLDAAKARENETVALNLAESANNQKEIALKNADTARKAEASALKVARVAQDETTKVKTEIQSIIQPSDKAYNDNIIGKLVQFTITIDYEDRLSRINNKVITMQGLPVKIGDDYVFIVPLGQIGLDPTSTHDNYITYNIMVNAKPVRSMYVKPGEVKLAALVIDDEVEHCLPVGKTDSFSSYMPILFSIRNQKTLGTMDRIRGISNDYFIFKRDHLQMVTEDEFYLENEGFRGTGNYAEYIVKGDQVVDLGGNFLGIAYKKNTISRIDNFKGWYKIPLQGVSAKELANHIYRVNKL